ncbi:aldehyde dehydrogenase family protein [Arthrobacter nitrophenolicus]|uniref:Aldehyde dehydrogenase family protein n=1 Tax=Arthrobacter nitrophenolicus TaxID=683150 RepID=A0A4R5XJS7_9MICC|nr:aldehyde dehydrogenase family protein [Arthrobacter nitrophenolicus]TDL31570.1 aldehyde dehydrogenase family protein [Arthrobacter nitrophenolicus]
MGTIHSIDPATGTELATFQEDPDEAVENKLAAAAAALPQLGAAGWGGRAAWMRSAADILETEVEAVALMITKEMGKPIAQSKAEVLKSAHTMRFYADNAEQFLTGRTLDNPGAVNASTAGTRFDPLGVILAVMPWNYPIWQVVRFAAPALMAGNAGVLKHASNVPQSAIYLGELFTRAGFPKGAFATLLIGSARVADVIRDPRVAAVTLTGSEGAGRSIAATAGDVLKKAVLELGGSDPFIVMPSADINAAVDTAVKSRTANNGQACINAKRFIVHQDIYDEFTVKFANKMSSLIVGDPTDPATEVGPLATESGRREVTELVEDARLKGADIITGTSPGTHESGWFYTPTVVTGLTQEMRLWAEEAFGPVASVYRAADLDEALSIANGLEFGLGSAFWSTNDDEIDRAIREIEAGAVFINGMTISYAELPFGGIKRSGYGRELSMEGIREFCNLKTVWVA